MRPSAELNRVSIARFENEIRAERQQDGVKKANERGVKFGKVKALTDEQADELRENGALVKDLMVEYKLSNMSVYRYLKR